MTFRVGQKVVCINDDPNAFYPAGRGDLDGLMKGCIYTVREIGLIGYAGHACVRLEELRRPDKYDNDCPYAAARFRPIVERKTDISIFARMLDPENHKQFEDAQ